MRGAFLLLLLAFFCYAKVPSCYDLLGISKSATDKQIDEAFRAAALKYHPDKNPDGGDMFQKVRVARDVLKDNRETYDQQLRMGNPECEEPKGFQQYTRFAREKTREVIELVELTDGWVFYAIKGLFAFFWLTCCYGCCCCGCCRTIKYNWLIVLGIAAAIAAIPGGNITLTVNN